MERPYRVNLNASLFYDTNVARGAAQGALSRGGEDWIFSPGVTLAVNSNVGRHRVFGRAGAFYDFYAENEQLNRERLFVDGGAASRLGRCESTVTLGYDRGRTDLLTFDLGLEDDPENIVTRSRAGLSVACPMQSGFSPNASYQRSRTENSSAVRQTLDADVDTFVAGLTYRRPALGAVTVFGSRSETNYRQAPNDGFDTESFGASYSRDIGARLTGTVRAASTKVEPKSPSVEGFSGATYGADLTARVGPRLSLDIAYDRRVDPGQRIGAQFTIRDSGRFRVNYRASSRVTLSTGVSRDKLQSRGGLLPATFARDETLDAVFASVRYQPTQRWALVADVRHDKQDTTDQSFSYSGTRAGVTASLSF